MTMRHMRLGELCKKCLCYAVAFTGDVSITILVHFFFNGWGLFSRVALFFIDTRESLKNRFCPRPAEELSQ